MTNRESDVYGVLGAYDESENTLWLSDSFGGGITIDSVHNLTHDDLALEIENFVRSLAGAIADELIEELEPVLFTLDEDEEDDE